MPDMLDTILARRSLRMPFDPQRPVSDEDLAKILEAARWSPTAHNMQNFEIIVVDDQEVLKRIRDVERPVSETFVRENYGQLSFSVEELQRKKTGVLAAMFPPSWSNPDFRADALTTEERAAAQRPLAPTPVMLFVLYDPSRRAPASEGDFLGIMSVGCVMENIWLEAESLGIGLHIVSSLNDDPEVRRILAVPDDLVIAFACRLGYPAAEPRPYVRVRRDVADFAHRNRFGGGAL
jgi:nitroreductase